ncbi:MCM DNA helicase complex subunit [Geranomyces variabilis]|nr:MCM DNA helicase complex subunit [Geranomyces variabilis]
MAMAGADEHLRNLGADELFSERVRFFKEFLDEDYGESEYKEKIRKMMAARERRLIVNINHLRGYNREYAQGLLEVPMDFLPPFDQALKDIVLSLQNPSKEKLDDEVFHIGLDGSFGDHNVSPRNVSSSHLGRTISIEGIITRCSLVRPKVARSVHYCQKTEVFHMREYRDGTSLGNAVPTGSVYPKEDEEGNPLTTEFGYSSYRDYQTVSLQEMPERAPAGQLPRPLDVILDDDLADRVKPGDRVQIVGVFRSLGKHAASISAIFKTVILANNIRHLAKEIQQPQVTDEDIKSIKKIGRRDNVFELLSTSLAPSIYGHDYIKKAILLLLLGGIEKNLENGTHLRGDINMLLIGDPSTAKSQMLRFVLNIAPLAIATTGRGSSGVGLTAAVTQDKETGERTLEAGAMVLADRGVVCIDEFDKMNDIDRVAIHEVMEQQTVTIAKAGIHTSLNARCSVLAAANPAYGHYVIEKPPHENILLPDSLLSRFDLVFVVLDTTDDELNRMISEHVGRVHRYIQPGLEEGMPITDAMLQAATGGALASSAGGNANGNGDDDTHTQTEVFQKYNKLLHVGIRDPNASSSTSSTRSRKKKAAGKIELLSIGFLKKYLHYAKTRIKPELTMEATDYICHEYTDLRAAKEGEGDKYRTMPITARTLETLIRLSTAHAKARLSHRVEKCDAELAVEILKFALYKEVKNNNGNKKKRGAKRVKVDNGGSSDDDGSDSEESGSDGEYGSARATPRKARVGTNAAAAAAAAAGASAAADKLAAMTVDAEDEDEPLQATHSSRDGGAGHGTSPADDGPSSKSVQMSMPNDGQDNNDDDAAVVEDMDAERFASFRQHLHRVRQALEARFNNNGGSEEEEEEGGTLTLHDIRTRVNDSLLAQDADADEFRLAEVRGALRTMTQENNGVWFQEGGAETGAVAGGSVMFI